MSSESSKSTKKNKPASYYAMEKFDQQKVLSGTNKIPSIKEQKSLVTKKLLEQALGEDEVWCLIEKRWMDAWKMYVVLDDPKIEQAGGDVPGPIDNEVLIDNVDEFRASVSEAQDIPLVKLKRECQEHANFELIPLEAWDYLLTWFGGHHNGFAPTIARYTYKRSEHSDNHYLDIYPFFLRCSYLPLTSNTKPDEESEKTEPLKFEEFRFCKNTTFSDFKKVLMRRWTINPKARDSLCAETRLWSGYLGTPWKLVEEESLQLQEFERGVVVQYILEQRCLSKKFSLDLYMKKKVKQSTLSSRPAYYSTTSSGRSSSYSSWWGGGRSSYGSNSGNNSGGTPGVTGMSNLGNTCYMNSAIQCLTKIPAFREYFLSGEYKKDVNTNNPLGYKGKVAKTFGELMGMVWSGKHSVITPSGFKSTVGRYRDTFAGFGQQDSHEIINFVLDAIHEDLNRVKVKPVVDAVDGKGRPDEEVARESWEAYGKRNDSIITDKFQGMCRSEVMCPNCLCLHVKFDPFTFLSVPVPGLSMRKIKVKVILKQDREKQEYESVHPIEYKVEVKKAGLMANLRTNLSKMCGIPRDRLAIAECFRHKIFTFYSDNDRVSCIKDHETICAFELDAAIENSGVDHGEYMRGLMPFGEFNVVASAKPKKKKKKNSYNYYSAEKEILCFPVVLFVPNEKCTAKDMYDQTFEYLMRFATDEGKEKMKEMLGDCEGENRKNFFPEASKKEVLEILKLKEKMKKRIEEEQKKFEEEERMKKAEEDGEEELPVLQERPPTPPKEEDDEADKEDNDPDDEVDKEEELDNRKKLDSKKVLFKLIQYDVGMNYHSSSRDKKTRPLYYSSDQLVSVPPHPERTKRGYYYYYSASRDKYHIKFDLSFPSGYEKFFDFDKMRKYVVHEDVAAKKKKTKKSLKLSKCIEKFCEKEVLTKQNTFYCSRCKQHVESTKKIDIWQTNEILIIQLKRFSNSGGGFYGGRSKIGTFIDYPLELDISKFVVSKENKFNKYRLFAVSNHYGGLGGGHYTASAYAPRRGEKRDGRGQWYDFNDSSVSGTTGSSAINSAGYVLFYAAIGGDK